MGGVDRKGGATLRIWKRGAWTIRGDYSYKGGTCDPQENHGTTVKSSLCVQNILVLHLYENKNSQIIIH